MQRKNPVQAVRHRARHLVTVYDKYIRDVPSKPENLPIQPVEMPKKRRIRWSEDLEEVKIFHKDEIISKNGLPLLKTPSFGDNSLGNIHYNPFAIKSGTDENRAEVSSSAPCNAYEPAFINSSRVFTSLKQESLLLSSLAAENSSSLLPTPYSCPSFPRSFSSQEHTN